jgi:hypothetical protein
MKKVMFLLVSALFAVSAHSSSQSGASWCGYRDYFRISSDSHPGIYIKMASSDYEVSMHVIGPRSFELRDTELCKSGYAHVTLVDQGNNWCVLDIKDGPYMMHPTVDASCHGMKYKGTEYGGFNSYKYTISIG